MNPQPLKEPFDYLDGNWIAVWRQIRESWLWQDPDKLRAWLDLLMMANYEDGPFHFKGNTHQIKRGQIANTVRGLSERWGWHRKRVRAFIAQLEGDHALDVAYRTFDPKAKAWRDIKSTHGFLLLTVIRYPRKPFSVLKGTTNRPTTSPKGRPTTGSTAGPHLIIQEGESHDPATPGAASKPPSGEATGWGVPKELERLPHLSCDPQLCKRYVDLTKTWGDAYPSVDIPSELPAANAWLASNPDKPKKRIVSFLNNWMKNAQQRHQEKAQALQSAGERKDYGPPKIN